jgi:hypothetical protein
MSRRSPAADHLLPSPRVRDKRVRDKRVRKDAPDPLLPRKVRKAKLRKDAPDLLLPRKVRKARVRALPEEELPPLLRSLPVSALRENSLSSVRMVRLPAADLPLPEKARRTRKVTDPDADHLLLKNLLNKKVSRPQDAELLPKRARRTKRVTDPDADLPLLLKSLPASALRESSLSSAKMVRHHAADHLLRRKVRELRAKRDAPDLPLPEKVRRTRKVIDPDADHLLLLKNLLAFVLSSVKRVTNSPLDADLPLRKVKRMVIAADLLLRSSLRTMTTGTMTITLGTMMTTLGTMMITTTMTTAGTTTTHGTTMTTRGTMTTTTTTTIHTPPTTTGTATMMTGTTTTTPGTTMTGPITTMTTPGTTMITPTGTEEIACKGGFECSKFP